MIIFLSCCWLFGRGLAQFPPKFDHNVDLPTERPLIIAHQGSCGRYPEHSLPGYERAIADGTDVIECDMCITRDLRIICAHESWLNASTNIADVYPESRMNTYFIYGHLKNITDYFSVDFTLEELKVVMRRQREPFRDPSYNNMFPIVTLEELIELVQSENRSIGLHLETKESIWTNSLDLLRNANVTLEDIVLDILDSYNMTKPNQPYFLQSFSRRSVDYLAARTELPVLMLLNEFSDVSDDALAEYAEFAYGVGPTKDWIVEKTDSGEIIGRTDFVDRAHSFGLKVHSFTMRNEDRFLAWDYGQDPRNEYLDYLHLEVDGLFTDFPETYSNFLNFVYDCQV
jgi:glycerophosphoryl diester phosphodiesterase